MDQAKLRQHMAGSSMRETIEKAETARQDRVFASLVSGPAGRPAGLLALTGFLVRSLFGALSVRDCGIGARLHKLAPGLRCYCSSFRLPT